MVRRRRRFGSACRSVAVVASAGAQRRRPLSRSGSLSASGLLRPATQSTYSSSWRRPRRGRSAGRRRLGGTGCAGTARAGPGPSRRLAAAAAAVRVPAGRRRPGRRARRRPPGRRRRCRSASHRRLTGPWCSAARRGPVRGERRCRAEVGPRRGGAPVPAQVGQLVSAGGASPVDAARRDVPRPDRPAAPAGRSAPAGVGAAGRSGPPGWTARPARGRPGWPGVGLVGRWGRRRRWPAAGPAAAGCRGRRRRDRPAAGRGCVGASVAAGCGRSAGSAGGRRGVRRRSARRPAGCRARSAPGRGHRVGGAARSVAPARGRRCGARGDGVRVGAVARGLRRGRRAGRRRGAGPCARRTADRQPGWPSASRARRCRRPLRRRPSVGGDPARGWIVARMPAQVAPVDPSGAADGGRASPSGPGSGRPGLTGRPVTVGRGPRPGRHRAGRSAVPDRCRRRAGRSAVGSTVADARGRGPPARPPWRVGVDGGRGRRRSGSPGGAAVAGSGARMSVGSIAASGRHRWRGRQQRPAQQGGGCRAERAGDDRDQRAVVGRELVAVRRRRPDRRSGRRRPRSTGPAAPAAPPTSGGCPRRRASPPVAAPASSATHGQQQHRQPLRGARRRARTARGRRAVRWRSGSVGDERRRDGEQRQQPDRAGQRRATFQPSGGREQDGDRRARADHRARATAQMPTAQTGSTRAQLGGPGRLHAERGDDDRAERGGAGDGQLQPVLLPEAVPAGEAPGEDGADHGGDRGEPADPGELGRPPVDGRR